MELIELNNEEMRAVDGGFVVALAGLLIAGFALGFEIGKSAAERARM